MKITQEAFVISELEKWGEISRNTCLKNFITRLGAIVCDLKEQGWVLEGEYRKTEHGKDYVYRLISKPLPSSLRPEVLAKKLQPKLL